MNLWARYTHEAERVPIWSGPEKIHDISMARPPKRGWDQRDPDER